MARRKQPTRLETSTINLPEQFETPETKDSVEAAGGISLSQGDIRMNISKVSTNFMTGKNVVDAAKALIGRNIEIDNPDTGTTVKGTILDVMVFHDEKDETEAVKTSRHNPHFIDRPAGTVVIRPIQGGGHCVVICAEDTNSYARIRLNEVEGLGSNASAIASAAGITKQTRDHFIDVDIFDAKSPIRINNDITPVSDVKTQTDKAFPCPVRNITAKKV